MAKITKKYLSFGTGAGEINSQDLPANFTPTYYTPVQVGTEGNTKVSAHLKGIDNTLAGVDVSGSASLLNNQTTFADILGLSFNGSLVRSAEIKYSIYRSTSSVEDVTIGTIRIGYLTNSSTWVISYDSILSNAGIEFDITNLGQVQYKSSNLAGSSHVGTLKFAYKAFTV